MVPTYELAIWTLGINLKSLTNSYYDEYECKRFKVLEIRIIYIILANICLDDSSSYLEFHRELFSSKFKRSGLQLFTFGPTNFNKDPKNIGVNRFKEGPLTKNGPIELTQSWAIHMKKSN
jgi:hypothetical protein